MSESRDTDRFPTRDQRPSVACLIILALSGSRALQPEQNNCGHAHDGLHSCMSRTRNICDVSATLRMVALHMQRTCVAAALTARVRHHDANLTACVRHHATAHTCTHTGTCPCCFMILPLITHAPSICPSALPYMSAHPALDDTDLVPHVHGR